MTMSATVVANIRKPPGLATSLTLSSPERVSKLLATQHKGEGWVLTKGILVEIGDCVLGIAREYTRRPDLRPCHPCIPESIHSEVPNERTGRLNHRCGEERSLWGRTCWSLALKSSIPVKNNRIGVCLDLNRDQLTTASKWERDSASRVYDQWSRI
jgi:hypothetical protein